MPPRKDKSGGKSSGKSSKQVAGDSVTYPGVWSVWVRDDENQRFVAHRLTSPGQYEYKYEAYESTSAASQSQYSSSYQSVSESTNNYGSNSQSLSSSSSYASSSQSQAVSSLFSSVIPSEAQSSLQSIPESPPYTPPLHYTHMSNVNSLTSVLQGMSMDMVLQDEKDKDGPKTGTLIQTRNPKKKTELGPFGGPEYKIHHEREFKAGKVLVINWVEPAGNSKGGGSYRSDHTVITTEYEAGTDQYQKARRFLIFKAFRGHCLCLPINTYSNQGVNKPGVHAETHAAIWSDYLEYGPGELAKLKRPSIRMVTTNPVNKLHPMSRLNYSKVYTIEYNVKVRFIGRIHNDSGHHVAAAYNDIHGTIQPFHGATNTSQQIGESSRAQQPRNSSYLGSGQSEAATGYYVNTPYSGSSATQQGQNTIYGSVPAYSQNTPHFSYSQNTTYGRTMGNEQNAGHNTGDGGSSSQSSGGTPRSLPYQSSAQQSNASAYNTRHFPTSSYTQQPSYSSTQAQSLPSSSYPGGAGYQANDYYPSTNYPNREYDHRDDDLYDP